MWVLTTEKRRRIMVFENAFKNSHLAMCQSYAAS